MLKKPYSAAFSLVELLVALAILSVVAAIIVPRFLSVRKEAIIVTASAQVKELNNVARKWTGLGGRPGSATGAQVVEFLCTDGTQANSRRSLSFNPCRDATSEFGSYMIGIAASAPVACVVHSSLEDGFYIAGAPIVPNGGTGSTIATNELVYKQGDFAFQVDSTISGDQVNFRLALDSSSTPAYCILPPSGENVSGGGATMDSGPPGGE